jgi:predicted flavoprotein YhiN
MSEIDWDVIIIGAGAAGLLAAASAGERGKKVLVLEKNSKIGVKILMSGGTRCNITHDCDIRGIIAAFGRQGKFLHSALAAFPPQEIIRKLSALGVATKIEASGKIFPVSDRAIDVRDALVRWAEQSGARIEAGQGVLGVTRTSDGFELETAQRKWKCRSLVVATGGKSYPGCGTTGDGYGWAEQFGHTIVPTFPALTPILSAEEWVFRLKGVTLDLVGVQVEEPDFGPNEDFFAANRSPLPTPSQTPLDGSEGTVASSKKKKRPTVLDQREGALLFTHWGFSGPVILDVSREIARHPHRNRLNLICDFYPQVKPEEFLQQLLKRKQDHPRQAAIHLLPESFPRRFQEEMLGLAGIDPGTRNADLSKKQMSGLVGAIKQSRLAVRGTLGFEKAEVTSGGVSLSEVDSKTMQSKLVERLFFIGEVLDLDGRIGGYNFQSAFSTGYLAGKWV